MAIDEHSIIERYFRPLAGEGAFDLLDDAGRLTAPRGKDLVVTADMICAGVHFLPGDPPETIARKALRVNISDLAAKGATPLAYVLAAAFPPTLEESWLAAFCGGLQADQQEFGISLLGGDTVAIPAGAPVFSITAFGTVPKGGMVHRSGGQPGDLLYVSGAIGASAAGLALLIGSPGPWDALSMRDKRDLIARYRLPEPRPALVPALLSCAHAAMDISDGLVGDCDKLTAASRCSAVIDAKAIPLPVSLRAAASAPQRLAKLITGGDDYEILAAIPPERETEFREAAEAARMPVTRIGVLREGEGPTEVRHGGRPMSLPQRSYVHGGGDGA